jgi:hypothetical protein
VIEKIRLSLPMYFSMPGSSVYTLRSTRSPINLALCVKYRPP